MMAYRTKNDSYELRFERLFIQIAETHRISISIFPAQILFRGM